MDHRTKILFPVPPLKVIMFNASCELAVWIECDEREKVLKESLRESLSGTGTINRELLCPSKSRTTTHVLNTEEKKVFQMFSMWLLSRQVCSPLVFLWTVSAGPACFALLIPLCFVERLKWRLPASYNYKELISLAALIIIIKNGLQGYVSSPSLIYACNVSKKDAVSTSFLNTQDLCWKTLVTLQSEVCGQMLGLHDFHNAENANGIIESMLQKRNLQ